MTKELLLALIAQGKTQRQIAAETGKSQTSIRYWRNKFGIKHRFKHEVYTKEHLSRVVAESLSLAGVLKKLHISISSAAYRYLKQRIARDSISTCHFTGQRTNAGVIKLTPAAIFASTKDRLPAKYLRRALLASGSAYRCNECGLSAWRKKALCLEIDHIDGNRCNNQKKNLRFMCPNCHSQTPTYGQRSAN
jgi:predicted RNA-binding Zn-ribbon protein involved in translation (DUF1610 family)